MPVSTRNIIAGLGALAVAGGLTAAFFMSGGTDPEEQSYPHLTLDSQTLEQYPDEPGLISGFLNSEDFKDSYTVVDYVAGWCPYCTALKPEMDEALTNLAEDGLDVARITVVIQEGNSQTHQRGPIAYFNNFHEMTRDSGEQGIPHVQLWKDGTQLDHFVGAQRAADIEDYIRFYIDMYEPDAAPESQPKEQNSPNP